MQKLVDNVRMDVCKKCNFYRKGLEVCGGECLPIDRAIIKNIEGKGLCSEVKEYVKDIEV